MLAVYTFIKQGIPNDCTGCPLLLGNKKALFT